MRRPARVIHLARRRLGPLLIKLQSTTIEEWPPHLNIAYELLHRKSALADRKIRSLIIESVQAAHACGKAINRQSDRIVEFKTRHKLRNTFKRFANCAKRAPQKLRKRLNEGILPLIRDNPADSEVIETILSATVAAFLEFPEEEATETALRLRHKLPVNFDRVAEIKNHYSVLDNLCQRKAEDAITEIAKAPNKKTIASDVLRGLASALNSNESKKVSAATHALIVDYVVTVAKLWRRIRLKPSRARHASNPTYKSRFHVFVDLVLTAVIEPWSSRHLKSVDDLREQTRIDYDRLPAALRAIAGPHRHFLPCQRLPRKKGAPEKIFKNNAPIAVS